MSIHFMMIMIGGYARLNRASVVVSVMAQVTEKSWARFLQKLGFEERDTKA